MLNILNLGAGRQSSYLYHASGRGLLPRLDCAIFSDTGWERQVTYDHLQWLKDEWEPEYGIPIHWIGKKSLREDAMNSQVRGTKESGSRWASMPLRTKNPDGSGGMIKRQCTKEYKIEVIERFIKAELLGLKPRQHWPKEHTVRQWFGISKDEWTRMAKPLTRRTEKVFRGKDLLGEDVYEERKVPKPIQWRSNVYYLCGSEWKWAGDKCQHIELGGTRMTADDCVQWHLDNGLPEPPNSACIGCPFRDNKSWREIKSDPKEWADVTEFDDSIRDCGGTRGEIFLHRDLVPLREAYLGEDKDVEFGCDEGWCESPN